MLTPQSLTPEQWDLVTDAPSLAGMAVTVMDFGVVSAVKEAAAIERTIRGAAEQRSTPLFQAILERVGDDDAAPVKTSGDPDEVVQEMLAKVGAAVRHVAAAAPDEAPSYRELILAVAEAAANASGSGWFGFGAKLSESEQQYLERLRAAIA